MSLEGRFFSNRPPLEPNYIPYKYDELFKTDLKNDVKYTFVWEISEFSLRPEENGERLHSKVFTIKGPSDKVTKWSVQLYPRGKKKIDKNYVSIYLVSMIDEDVEAKYIFSTLDANKVKQKIFDGFFEGKEGWGRDKAIQRSKISQHTPSDNLTLFVEVTVSGLDK